MLKTREELSALRQTLGGRFASQVKKILVCAGTGCVAGGSLDIYARLVELLQEKGIHCQVDLAHEPHGDDVGVKRSGCHGFCEMGPLVRIEPQGWLYIKVKKDDCQEIIEKTVLGGEPIERLCYKMNGEIYKTQEEIPFYKKQTRTVLEHCGHIDATSIQEYIAIGGYKAFEKALFDMNGQEIVDENQKSNLRGRGGGGFPEMGSGARPGSHSQVHRLQR